MTFLRFVSCKQTTQDTRPTATQDVDTFLVCSLGLLHLAGRTVAARASQLAHSEGVRVWRVLSGHASWARSSGEVERRGRIVELPGRANDVSAKADGAATATPGGPDGLGSGNARHAPSAAT